MDVARTGEKSGKAETAENRESYSELPGFHHYWYCLFIEKNVPTIIAIHMQLIETQTECLIPAACMQRIITN